MPDRSALESIRLDMDLAVAHTKCCSQAPRGVHWLKISGTATIDSLTRPHKWMTRTVISSPDDSSCRTGQVWSIQIFRSDESFSSFAGHRRARWAMRVIDRVPSSEDESSLPFDSQWVQLELLPWDCPVLSGRMQQAGEPACTNSSR